MTERRRTGALLLALLFLGGALFTALPSSAFTPPPLPGDEEEIAPPPPPVFGEETPEPKKPEQEVKPAPKPKPTPKPQPKPQTKPKTKPKAEPKEPSYTLDQLFKMGMNAYKGENGAAQSYAEALKWWGRAAAKGHAVAQYNMGIMHKNGEGRKRIIKRPGTTSSSRPGTSTPMPRNSSATFTTEISSGSRTTARRTGGTSRPLRKTGPSPSSASD